MNGRKPRNDGPQHRIFKPKRIRTPRYRTRRMIILGTVVVTFLFLTKLFVGLFDFEHVHVNIILTGNSHYTEGHIFDVLGGNLQNIITDTESETSTYLKDNLSYINEAYISKNYLKRQLSVEITERKPFARVKHILSSDETLDLIGLNETATKSNGETIYLIDEVGHVLESITDDKYLQMTLLLDEGKHLPEVGKQIKSGITHRGIQILKHINTNKAELQKLLKSIDARVSDKIIIKLKNFPFSVWISSDMLETGLHSVGLFIKQKGLLTLQQRKYNLYIENPKDKKVKELPEQYTYLDCRYEDTIFLGGDSR